jgi:hypothetical protein
VLSDFATTYSKWGKLEKGQLWDMPPKRFAPPSPPSPTSSSPSSAAASTSSSPSSSFGLVAAPLGVKSWKQGDVDVPPSSGGPNAFALQPKEGLEVHFDKEAEKVRENY